MLESLEVKDNPLGSRDYWSLNRLQKGEVLEAV